MKMNRLFITGNTADKQGISMRRTSITLYIAIAAVIISALIFPAFAADVDNPRILMSEYLINDGSSDVASTGNFTLNYTLVNPSEIEVVNVVLSYEQKNSLIIPVPGSANVEYIGAISAGGEYKGTISLYIPKTADAGICKLDFTISYNSSDPSVHTLFTSEFSIYINIENNTEITLKNIELSDEAAAGGRKRLLVEYENPGSRDFKNLKLVIDGNIEDQQKVQILPILKAGKSNSIEYYVQFTEIGEQNLSVHISYDDDGGNSYKTPLATKTVVIYDGDTVQPSSSVVPSEGYVSEIINRFKKILKKPEFTVIIIISFIAAVAVVVTIQKMRKRAKKKQWYYKNNNNNGG